MQIAFASDLHINGEKWTIDVLKELIEKSPPVLILGGDVFDSFQDLVKQKDNFISIVEKSNIEQVYFIPGNHDIKGGSLKEIEKLNFGNKIIAITQTPYSSVIIGEQEFIFAPFQKDLSKLYESEFSFPQLERIFVGHGSIMDYNFTNEEENSYFDNSFFDLIEANIVLLGHIHTPLQKGKIYYPGSARVWRKGEEGGHGFLLFDMNKRTSNFIPLESGGKFFSIKITVDENNYYIPPDVQNIDKNSFVEFVFDGVVNNISELETIKNELKSTYSAKEIYFTEENIVEIGQYYNSEIFKAFMKKWKELYELQTDENERENYLLARKLFLQELKSFSGGKD